MTISFSGLASGLDTSSWVESLVALKRAKVTTLQEQKQELVVSKDTLSSIKSFFTSFRSTIEKITKSPFNMVQMDLFAQNVATSANLNVLTATATPEAEEGTYRVKVDKLATKTSATSNKKYTTTIVETTTATADSKLKNIGVRAGNIAVDVNGIKYGISITDTDTIATFIDKLKNIGVEAGFNETTGVFTMKANASDIDDIDNTGIVEKLHLTDVNEGYETSNKLLVDKVETKVEIADANTSLKDLGLSSGTFQVSANGETYDIEINVDDTDATDTLGELVAALQANDIDARLSNGVFTINDAVITSEGTTNIITAMGLSEDVYTKSQQSKELSVETTAIATAGTKLSDIGDGVTVNDGDTVIVKNSNNVQTEIVLQEESTIGDLLAAISNAGLYAAINNDGTIEISGGQIVGGTFDAVEVFGLESEPASAMVTGNSLTETVVEHKIVDLETKLVDDLGVTEGYLEVTDADGNKYYEKIYSGQTIADFMADMGNLGIYTSLDEETGILEITGGAFRTLDNDNDEAGSLIANGTIVETDPNFPATGTNLLECLYGSPVITTGQIEVASAYSRTRALSRTITNTVNATTDTTLGALGLTIEGTAEFNVRGDIRTIDITSTMTIEELQNALTAQGIESAWDSDNSRLTINNATLEGGTSDLADVLNLEETIAGKYTTSDALYATNNYSTEATRESLLSEYGISAEEEVLLYTEDHPVQTITVSGSTSLGTLLDTLNTMGVTATLANGILNIEDGYLVNANLETALGLTRRTSGSSHILGNQVTYTVTTAVTGTSELGDVISALGTESEVAGGYSLVFNTTTLAVDSSTTLNDMIEQINAAGGSARLDSTGRIHVEGGALTGTVAEALGFATTTITTAVSATGEELKTTVTMLADETTTFGELGITEDGSITVRDSSGNLLDTIDITAGMTLKEFFNELSANDINASIKDGKITLESISGNYLEGDIAETLGIAFDDMSFDVSTITTGMTATSTVAVTYLSTIHATGTTTLDDLGVVLNDIDTITGFTNEVTQLTQAEAEAAGYTWVTDRAGLTTALTNNENVVLGADIDLSSEDWTPISTYSGTLDGNGYVIRNMTSSSGLIDTLNGTIKNLGFENATAESTSHAGLLADSSSGATIENCYVANSSVLSTSGNAGGLIGYATSTTVSSTNAINVVVNSRYSNGSAGGLIGYANSVTVSGTNVIGCNISTSSTSSYSGYGAGGIIGRAYSGATISDSRVHNSQVEALQSGAGGAIGGVHRATVTISNTEVNCQAIGQRAGNLVGYIVGTSSSVAITLEDNSYNSSNGLASYGGKSSSSTTITESGTTAYFGFGNDLSVHNAFGDTIGTINLEGTSSINDIFSALAAYGISGKINNGEIILTSADGNFIAGDVARQLGINIVESGSAISTTNFAQTSSSKVTYTTTLNIDGIETFSDLGIYTGPGFVKEVDRMTRIDAISAGYTWVTTRAELTAAISAKKNIMLGADIDLSGEDWTPISYTGTIDNHLTLDGNGYVIKNMTVNTSGNTNTAFISDSSFSTIKNLGFENANVTNDSSAANVAVVIAYSSGQLSIDNCYIDNSTVSGGGNTAGFIGYVTGGASIYNSAVGNLALESSSTPYLFAYGPNYDTIAGSYNYYASSNTASKINSEQAGTFSAGSYTPGEGILVNDSAGNVIGTLNLSASTTIDDMLGQLEAYGIGSSLEDGVISLYSSDGKYVSGYVAERLGLKVANRITQTVTAVATTTSTMADLGVDTSNPKFVNAISRMTQAEAEAAGYTWVTDRAGLTSALATGDSSVKVMLGADIDLFGEDWTAIGNDSNGFLGTLDGNGYVIKNMTVNGIGDYTSGFFGYLGEGALVQNLGFENVTVTSTNTFAGVVASSASGTIENCYVANSSVTSKEGGAGGLVGSVCNLSVNSCNVLDTTISGAITGGVLGYVSSDVNLSITNTNIYNVFSNGTIYAGGILAGIDSSAQLTIDNVKVKASVNTSASHGAGIIIGCIYNGDANVSNVVYDSMGTVTNQYGLDNGTYTPTNVNEGSFFVGSSLGVLDKSGNLLGTINVNSTTSIGDIFTQLSAYGIAGSIDENGVITLSSADGKTVGGTVADQLGLTVSQRLTQTVTAVATTTSTMADLGVDTSNPKFVNAITRMSQAEAEAAGYTWVTDRAGLESALAVNGAKIMLGADIDLGDSVWAGAGSVDIDYSYELDGNGYVIKNMNTESGFFKNIDTLILRNVGFENATVNSSTSSYIGCAGVIASTVESGEITNCYVSNSSVTATIMNVGALIGASHGYETGNVVIDACNVYESAMTTNGNAAGGIVGMASSSSIEITNSNVYSSTIIGNEIAGGIIGINNQSSSSIISCNIDATIECNDTAKSGAIIGITQSITISDVNYSSNMDSVVYGSASPVVPTINNVQQLADVGQNSAGTGLCVLDKSGNLLGTINVNSTTSIGDLFTQLSAYGIAGSIDSNGVITLNSSNGNYIAGTIADQLGIGTVATGNTILVGSTATSGDKVLCMTEKVATLDSKIYDFDHTTNPTFNGTITASGVTGTIIAISTVEDLVNLANLVNAGNNMEGKSFYLTNDINLASVENWTSIGNASNAFSGSFNGQDYTIYNLNQTIPETPGATVYAGLFGRTYNATLSNFNLENANITGTIKDSSTLYIGAAVGYAYGSNVAEAITYIDAHNINIDIYREYDGSSTSYVGGIAGYIINVQSVQYLNVYSGSINYDQSSTTTTYDYTGGVAGDANAGSYFSYLYNAANVSGETYAGGVIGNSSVGYASLEKAANTGSVDAKYAGGLLGYIHGGSNTGRYIIEQSYSTGTITGEYASESVGAFGGLSGIDFYQCGALTSLTPAYSTGGTHNYYMSYIGQAAIENGFSTWLSIDGVLVPGVSGSITIATKIGNSYKATITVDATTTFADLFEKLGEYDINCSLEDGMISIACNGDYFARGSILSYLGLTYERSYQTIPKTCTSTVAVTYTETIAAQASTTLGELSQYNYKIDGTISASGVTGTVIGISTVADLQNLANLVNSGSTMAGKTFVLTNDIDLSSVDNWTSIGGYSSGTLRTFNGTFDGQGYTISNLTQNSEITTSNGATESLSGLFGYVDGAATIKNLTLSNFNITTVNNNTSAYASRVGALIGQMNTGTVSGITVENLTLNAGANSEVGGIIGMATAGTILNSSTSGTISGSNTAGIIGRLVNWSGNLKIDNCQNNANITASHNAGGIVGTLGLQRDVEITNVLNKGTISSNINASGIIANVTSYSNYAVDFTLTNAVNLAKVTNTASTSRDIMTANGTLNASSTITIDNCFGYYTSTTSTTSAINVSNWSGVTLGTVQNNLSPSSIGTNLRNSGCDLEKWSLGTSTSTLNLKTGDDYDMFVYNSTTGVLTEKVDLNAGSSLQYVATALNDRGDVVITGNELSYVPTYATMAVAGTGAQILNTPLTTTTLATMTSDTTIAELGVTGNTTITVRAMGTSAIIYVTVASSETVGDVMTKLAAYGFESKIDNGKLTVKSADNDYYIYGATGTLESALKINFGSDVSYYPSGTVYTSTTDGRQLVATELTELNSNSTFESLGISTDAYITINSNGTEYVHTLAASQTLGDMMNILSAYGIASSISDGKLTIYSNSNACIQGMDDRLLASLNLGSNDNLNEQIAEVKNTSSNQLQSATVSVSTQMTSNSLESERVSSSMSSNTLTIQETSTLGFETKFSELGISDTNFITINSNGIYSTVTIEATDTVGEMLSALAGYGITGSIEDGKITIKGNKDDYITDISDNLASKIKLDFDVNDFTYDVVYSNTSSNTLGIEGTATINSDTTFAELGATDDNFITVVTAGTEHVITVRATNTVGEILANLSAYGIAGTIDDGKVVLTPTGYNYVKDMSDELEGYLHIAEPYYSETSGSVGTATSDEFVEINTINAITTTQLGNLVDELGVALAGYDIEITSISAAGTNTYTHTFAATDTIQDVIDKLREYGITATLNAEGRFDMASTVLTDFEVAGSLGEYLMGNYVDTKVYNETNTQNVSSILSQETDTLMTDSTKLSDIGITDGEIQISINDEIKTITVDSTSTIADFRIQLADIGLSSNLIDGRISIVTDKNVSFTTPVDGSNAVTILGLNNISSETEYSQTSKWLGDTGTSEGAAGMDTMISQLKDSSGNLLGITSGKVYVYQDGTRSVININTNETLNDLATKLSQYGITMGISSNGVLYFDGDNNSYLTTEGLASGEASNFLEKIGVNTEWNTRYNSTSETLDFEEQENTTVNGSTLLSDLQDSSGNNLGITEGNYYVYQNGVRNTESISADTTVNDFIATLSTYGMTATFDENGSLSVGADSNTYLATAATAGANTNAIDVLFEEWNFTNIYTSNGLDVPTDITVAISETTKLADINEKDGSGNGYQAGYITVVKDGVQTDIELTADDTVGDLMDELALYGFESVINANGQLIIKNTGDSRLQAYNGAGVKSNALEILGVRNEDWISTNAYQGSILEATSTDKVAATRDTLLSDLGISTGEYYVYNNGVKYTALISSDETVGSLMDTLKSFGLETSLTTSADGTKSVIKILGNGDAYIAKSTSVAGSANIEDLFELTTTNSYSYSGIQETSELVTSQVNATEDTLLSTYDDVPNGKTAEGNLSVTIDGVDSIICVEADETIGSLIHKFEALGLEADYIDGNIVIQSGYKDFTINTDGTNPTDSNILDTIGLVYNDNLGNYLASSNIVEQTTSEETVLTLSAANFATDDTTFDLLSITTGTLSIYRDGQKATLTVESEKTFAQFKDDVKDCFADVEVDIDEKGFLYFKSTTSGVKVEVGATTDTSNFAAITGITNDGSGVVKSARELYCVNSSSIITTSGIFRDGDVKAGTFTVGEEEFTITNTTTISDIISQINASQKAKATAYWDSVDGKFVIQSRTTGSSLINIEAGTSNFTDVMGFTTSEWADGDGDGAPDVGDAEASVTKLKVESQEIGENAVFSINGTYYTSTSNTIDSSVSRIKGLTIDLKGVSEGGETTITVERDKETLANAVSDVVDAYNALIEGVDKEIAKGSPLDDQFTLKLLRNQIRNMMTNSFAGLGAFQNLDQIGIVLDKATAGNISTDRIDTLTFDKDKFFDAYNADRDSLKSILVGTESVKGIFSQLEENVLGNALKYASGYFSSAEKSYNNQIQRLNAKIEKEQKAVERYKERLEAKFASMDLLISQMQSQFSSFLGT